MGTGDTHEYNRLVDQKDALEDEYGACEARIEDYESRLELLRSAKRRIAEQKDEFELVMANDKTCINSSYQWKGDRYRDFINGGDYVLEMNESYFRNYLDVALDSINDEITRIENLRRDDFWLLDDLCSCINNILNEIENFFN